MVARCADSFIDHVAEARSMDRDGIVAQQARFYSGQQVLDLGLVDKFMSYGDSMKEFAEVVNGTARRPAAATPGRSRAGAMSTKEKKMDTIESALAAVMQPDCAEADARAALTALHTAATAAGKDAGVTAERSRFTALAELDSGSTVSDSLAAAIEAGTSAGDFAIDLQKKAKAAGADALAAAREESPDPNSLPASGAHQPGAKAPANRGRAYAERKKAKASA
jgi:hypothetical protein